MSGDKEFFVALGDVLPANIGLDRRIQRQYPLVLKAQVLRSKGHTWQQIIEKLDPQYERGLDADQLRILVKRYSDQGLI